MKDTFTVGKVFPNLNDRVASYDPATQFVSFELMTRKRFDELIDKPYEVGSEKEHGVIIHEFRHAIDHLATLWGQNNLLKLQKALSAKLSSDEEKFHHMITYKRDENQIFHGDYYSETYSQFVYAGVDSHWKSYSSIGVRFDSDGRIDSARPILFTRFDTIDGKKLMRVPINVSALIETNAMYEEINYILSAYKQAYGDDSWLDEKIYKDNILKSLLYNQSMAVYNVAVHTVKQFMNIDDLLTSFRVASSIATVALNMPASLAVQLPLQGYFGEQLIRAQSLLKNNDRGFVFYTLCKNYVANVPYNEFKLEFLLAANSLPEEDNFKHFVQEEFLKIQLEMSKETFFYERFSHYNNVGFNMFVIGGVDGMRGHVIEQLKSTGYRPPLVFSGGDGIDTYNDALARLAAGDDSFEDDSLWFNIVHDLSKKMDEFYVVRGL